MNLIKITMLFTLISLVAGCSQSLPKCDSKKSKDLMAQIVNRNGWIWGKFVKVSDIYEETYNKDQQIRTCTAVLKTTKDTNGIDYSITWQNREKNQYHMTMIFQ